MKMLGLIAAAFIGAVSLAPTTASAAAAPSAATVAVAGVAGVGQIRVRERTVIRNDRRYRGRGGYRAARWGNRRVCTNRRRNGRNVRVCRTVRYRR